MALRRLFGVVFDCADLSYCLCWYVMSVCCFGFVCVADLMVLVVLFVLGFA